MLSRSAGKQHFEKGCFLSLDFKKQDPARKSFEGFSLSRYLKKQGVTFTYQSYNLRNKFSCVLR